MISGLVTKVGLVVVLVVGLAGGGAFYFLGSDLQFEPPVVESIESEFGAVEQESAQIQTRVVVRNPNERAIPGSATIEYQVALNDITVADGKQGGVRIGPGESVVELSTGFDNSKVPAWWVSHVNNGERSTMRIVPSVSVGGVLNHQLPAQEVTIETEFLGPLANGEAVEVFLANRSVLVVEEQRAHWGEATMERTPVVVETTLTNTHDQPITLDGTVYEIRMNDVVVGEGTTGEGLELTPGERGTLTVEAAIDTARMQAWWVSHLRQEETTTLDISVYGVVEEGGERTRLPLSLFERHATFETDVLGGGGTSVELLEPTVDSTFTPPAIEGLESRWGTVDDDTTEIVTDVELVGPEDERLADLVTLSVDQRTTINGVTVAESTSTVESIPAGDGTISTASEMAHSTVPEWWARHLNNGERSTIRTTTEARADLGVTSFAVDVPDTTTEVETSIVEGFDNDTVQTVTTEDGRAILEIERTRGSWGTATAAEAPLNVAVTVENQQPRRIDIRDITYVVRINDVVLANRTAPETYEVAGLQTETIEPTLYLDNRKMAEWWPTHVENGERSTIETEVWVTVESASLQSGTTVKRVKLDSFGGEYTVETSIFD